MRPRRSQKKQAPVADIDWKVPSLMSLDGCRFLYLDLGSNRGGNIRALFQEKLMKLEGSPLPAFMAEVGDPETRSKPFNETGICAIAFEGNPEFREEHTTIETAFNAYGWKVQFMSPAVVLDREGSMTFYTGHPGGKQTGSSVVHRGRGKHKTSHTVPAVDFPKLVQDYIVPARNKGTLEKVVMHMDVEAAEYLILPKMAEGQGLCQESGISKIVIEYHEFHPQECIYCDEKAVTALLKESAAKHSCTLTEFDDTDVDLYDTADNVPLPM